MALLALFRSLAFAGLTVAMLQPQRQTEEVTLVRPQIAVLVDTSASMNDPVDKAQPRRAQRVAEFLGSPAVRDARRNYDVRVFDLAQNELPVGPPPASFNGNASDLTGGLRALVEHFKGQPLAAVLVLSDGLDTTGVARPENVAAGVPVDTFELERPFKPKKRPQHISIVGADYPRRAVVGWHSGIQISLAGSGLVGRVVPVELWRGGRKVADATAAFNEEQQTRNVSFEVTHDQPGTDQYEVRVQDAAADKEARAYPVSIEVAEPGRRVLYVQNQLSFDYKFLRKAIVSNRNLQLSSFTRWADGRIVSLDDSGGAAPTLDFSPRALAGNAVIILGDLAPDALPPESWRNLRDYVDRGGGLVLLGGPAAFTGARAEQTPLADVLPVRPPTVYREGSFPVQITETGLHHPVFRAGVRAGEGFPAPADGKHRRPVRPERGGAHADPRGRQGAAARGGGPLRRGADRQRDERQRVALAARRGAVAAGPIPLRTVLDPVARLARAQGVQRARRQHGRIVHRTLILPPGREAGGAGGRADRRRSGSARHAAACGCAPRTTARWNTRSGRALSRAATANRSTGTRRPWSRTSPASSARKPPRRSRAARPRAKRASSSPDPPRRSPESPWTVSSCKSWRRQARAGIMRWARGTVGPATCTSRSSTPHAWN